MNLSIRRPEKSPIVQAMKRVQKDLGTTTYTKTVYALIERHEPTQKEILQLRANVIELEAKLRAQEETLNYARQFVTSIIPQSNDNGKAKKKG